MLPLEQGSFPPGVYVLTTWKIQGASLQVSLFLKAPPCCNWGGQQRGSQAPCTFWMVNATPTLKSLCPTSGVVVTAAATALKGEWTASHFPGWVAIPRLATTSLDRDMLSIVKKKSWWLHMLFPWTAESFKHLAHSSAHTICCGT